MEIKNCILVPLEEVTIPKEGHEVLMNRWWVTINDKAVIYVGPDSCSYSPQCNSVKEITERIIKKIYPECTDVFVPVAYINIPHRIKYDNY